MNVRQLLTLALLPTSLTLSLPVAAGDGHDHGDSGTPVNANGPQRQPDGSVRGQRDDVAAGGGVAVAGDS